MQSEWAARVVSFDSDVTVAIACRSTVISVSCAAQRRFHDQGKWRLPQSWHTGIYLAISLIETGALAEDLQFTFWHTHLKNFYHC